ncbi:MAG: BlaI/MecI/CopY family transcriptional regulator [Ruminococcus sp.]|nr:BlaI/MecI/CopY family transcriptional regulator [Ruminococcus sp.]
MKNYTLGALESRFADIVWENAPLTTAELVKMSEKEFSWKRTTTYTVLKRLCNGGLFALNNGEITVVMSRDEFYSTQSECYVKENFGGSLPAFLSAFTSNRKLTSSEVEEIKKMIKTYEDK